MLQFLGLLLWSGSDPSFFLVWNALGHSYAGTRGFVVEVFDGIQAAKVLLHCGHLSGELPIMG